MTVTINGTTGIVAPAFDGAVDAADLTGAVPSASLVGVYNKGIEVLGAGTSIRWRNDAGASWVETKGTSTTITVMNVMFMQFGTIRFAVNIISVGNFVRLYRREAGNVETLIQDWTTTGSKTVDVTVEPGEIIYLSIQAQNNTTSVNNVRIQTNGQDLWATVPLTTFPYLGFEGNRAP